MTEKEILVRSSIDGTDQPSLFYEAEGEGRPLLVGLHTWSYDRHNQRERLLPLAERLGYHLLLPEFRGPNLDTNPHATEACGSVLAKTDILDAIDHVLKSTSADPSAVLLVGGSGGGHMALLMAGLAPERFAAIASVVPISDVGLWKDQNASYTRHILACTGGDCEEMRRRSPISYIDGIARANLKIFHGKRDPSVPVTQSIDLYNKLMEKYPRANIYLDIFDGGHEMCMDEVELFLTKQLKKKKADALSG